MEELIGVFYAGEDMEKRNSHALLIKMQIGTATMENSMTGPKIN